MKTIIATLLLAFTFTGVSAQTEKAEMVSKKDQKFITEAGQFGVMEVRLAELAQTNASAESVKQLGQSMAAEHTKINEELKMYADKKNVFFPAGMTEKQQKWYDKMAKKQGADFDKVYPKCVDMTHKKALCKYRKAAKKATDPELKSWAAQKVTVLEHHREMAKSTSASLKK